MERITLYYRQGSSDKIYQAGIAPQDGGYVVHFAYGRRGTTLQTGTKTLTPVGYDEARKIYDKLIAEKLAKGYTPGESGTPYQHTDRANAATGILPMLLNAIEPEEAVPLITDAAWSMQEKFDGKRILIRKSADGIEGINRKGLIVALPEPVVQASAGVSNTFILDGECVGNTLVAFDLLELDGRDYRGGQYRQRLFALMQIVPGHGPHLRSAETAFDTAHKTELLQRLRHDGREGVVFKRLAATYIAGRPATGGDALKLKFHETATFVVTGLNDQRSVSLGLYRGAQVVPAGNVTIPPNHDVPPQGASVEVRYLYAFPESGCVFQPVYLGIRDDIEPTECVAAQLKYKVEAQAA